jgi:hypothetical protein
MILMGCIASSWDQQWVWQEMARDSGVYVVLDPATPGWPRHRAGTAGHSIGGGIDRAFLPFQGCWTDHARPVKASASGRARTAVYGSFDLKLHYTCTGQKAQRAWIRVYDALAPVSLWVQS